MYFISLLWHRDASHPALLSTLTFVSSTAALLTQFMYQSPVVISCYFIFLEIYLFSWKCTNANQNQQQL